MAWTAEAIEKDFTNGILSVTMRFTEDKTGDVVTRTYRSQGEPGATWLADSVALDIKYLTSLSEYPIIIGPILPSPPPTKEDATFTAWKIAVGQLRRAQEFVDLGVLSTSDARILALRQVVADGIATYGDIG